ncbi:MAG TPA: HEAT repeat domain-containing protein, partial [Allocoleopsis sp.]
MSDTLSSLIGAVEQATSSGHLIRAVRNLAATRLEGAVPTLIAVLSYNNPGAAVAAVDGLINIG